MHMSYSTIHVRAIWIFLLCGSKVLCTSLSPRPSQPQHYWEAIHVYAVDKRSGTRRHYASLHVYDCVWIYRFYHMTTAIMENFNNTRYLGLGRRYEAGICTIVISVNRAFK